MDFQYHFSEEDIFAIYGFKEYIGSCDFTFNNISTDTRDIEKDDLFVCLIGRRFDGHNFIEEAINKGAKTILVDDKHNIEYKNFNANFIVVYDTLKAYQSLAKIHRDKFQIPVVAITGSNGKTSTKDITGAILRAKFNVLKTEGNFNNEIGLPKSLLHLDKEHGVAVVEMGMRGLGQIKELTEIAKPNIGIITNVGQSHLELLGSVNNIKKAKAELVEALKEDGIAILNGDDENVLAMKDLAKGKVITYGLKNTNTVYATDIKFEAIGLTTFVLNYKNIKRKITVPLLGVHNVYNTLAGIACATILDINMDEVQSGLAHFHSLGNRFSVEDFNNVLLIDDSYNAAPISVKYAMENVKILNKNRSILVLGNMLELGDIAISSHKEIGQYAKELGFDAILTMGDLAKYASTEGKNLNMNVAMHFESHKDIAEFLNSYLVYGDAVLFKGSNGMKMGEVIKILKDIWSE